MSGVTTHRTACPLDCPDACSLAVEVEHGKIVSIDGDRRNPLTAGFICGKVRRFDRHVYGRDRLDRPLLRTGAKGDGAFTPIPWDDALDRIASRLVAIRDTHGGEAILPVCYGGSNGALTQQSADMRLFRRLGASRLLRTVCAAPTTAAATGLYGRMPGIALPDYEHAALTILWGCNPSASGIHLVPPLQRARAAGASLVVVDPRTTPLARTATIHLAPRPGTDLVIALAIARWLFAEGKADLEFLAAHAAEVDVFRERCAPWTIARAAATAEIDAGALVATAELYAASSPAAIRCGWGPERNRNGGSAIAAILALPAIAGKFGVLGGGYTMSNGRAMALDTEAAIAEPEPPTREVNMNQLGRALVDDDSIRAVFVYNCNPLATLPDQNAVRRGLGRDDLFTVVFDQVMTDTARWADVVLPATTFLEHDDLRAGYGAMIAQRSRPVIAPHGLARPNAEVFVALCDRTGCSKPDDPRSAEALAGAVIAGSRLPPDRAEALARDDLAAVPSGRVQLVDEHPRTPDGRIHLVPASLDAEHPAGLYTFLDHPDEEVADGHGRRRWPLVLISPALARQVSSTFGQLDRRPAALHMHPDDAASRGLVDGARIRVYNELGEVRCRVSLDDAVRPGVVSLAKGLWSHHTDNGATANALCSGALADLAGGATFNDARVEVEAAG